MTPLASPAGNRGPREAPPDPRSFSAPAMVASATAIVEAAALSFTTTVVREIGVVFRRSVTLVAAAPRKQLETTARDNTAPTGIYAHIFPPQPESTPPSRQIHARDN
jgi:hypothetical protein